MQQAKKHEHWSSQWLFIMATIGASVGLANIWRFPFTTGENGGGAFVLIYLGAVFFLALPLLIGELMLGRRGQACPTETMRLIAAQSGGSRWWVLLGYSGVITGVIILSYYCMIGGETLVYAAKNLMGSFVDIEAAQSLQISSDYNASWPTVLGGHTIFLAIMVFISSKGVSAGLEKAVKFMMPMLFIILIGMVIYAGVAGNFIQAVTYLFSPDFSKITISVVVEAFGQAFFSVGVGVTILMAYGSYMHRNDSVTNASLLVVAADTLVALLAGLAVFPIVFAFGLDPSGGPGLVFETIPLAFGHMPGGRFFGTLFFVLLAFAAITSAICLLEAPVAWLSDKDGWSRKKAAIVSGGAVWAVGIFPVLSLNVWQDFYPLGMMGIERTFFDLFDYMASNILLPIGGLFTAIFVGWVVPDKISSEELRTLEEHHWFRIWMFLLRYVVTLVLLIVFINLLLG
ncbi:sodium-dependent transporter [Gammaproteobacteria bacterium]|nr:sodium-dependent transporter [Gammaproteobacteria bacterium]